VSRRISLCRNTSLVNTHIQRIPLRSPLTLLDSVHASDKQLSCPVLKRKHVPWSELVQDILQGPEVRSQEEELPPEPLCSLAMVVILRQHRVSLSV
jgi:hypothetical protein